MLAKNFAKIVQTFPFTRKSVFYFRENNIFFAKSDNFSKLPCIFAPVLHVFSRKNIYIHENFRKNKYLLEKLPNTMTSKYVHKNVSDKFCLFCDKFKEK
jgi:hypothetical protein